MDTISTCDEKRVFLNLDRPTRVIVNGIHSKSGGGVTYLRKILPLLSKMPELEIHLFIHKSQFHLFYPVVEEINVCLFSYKETFLRTLIWEQIAIPIKAWALRSDVVFSPANYGPLLIRNHVILLRNAVSVIKLINDPRTILYWLGLSLATFVSFVAAKKSIAVSNYAKKLLTFGLSEKFTRKCSVVYHGVDHPLSDRMENVLHQSDILAVSDIYIQKNYDTLIKAISHLVKKRPRLRLVIIGEEIDQLYVKKVKALIKKLKVESNILFKGYVRNDEIMSYYMSCRVFVFPSHVETFGNSLLEAMACGAPIACSSAAVMPEIIGDGGLFFNPNDEYEIAEKIEELLVNDELSKKLSDEASRRATHFTWDVTALKTRDVLIDAAEQKSNKQIRPL